MIGAQLVKVLIIDDHEVVRLGVKQILEKALPHVELGEADGTKNNLPDLLDEGLAALGRSCTE